MTYYPDPPRYQQLGNGDPYGYADCTAWSGAYGVDADRAGTFKTTGTAIRHHSNEPVPDRSSPGLNLHQADEAILEITKGKVDLDIRTGFDIDRAESRIIDGRYSLLQVNRSILVNTGYGGGSTFRGGHCIVISYREGAPVIFDPLVKHVMRASWGPIWRAAGALVTGVGGYVVGYGRANVGFTRDVTPDWKATVPADTKLTRFVIDSKKIVTDRKRVSTPNGFTALCTPPYYIRRKRKSGVWESIKVVTVTSGAHTGWIIRSKWATQIR